MRLSILQAQQRASAPTQVPLLYTRCILNNIAYKLYMLENSLATEFYYSSICTIKLDTKQHTFH